MVSSPPWRVVFKSIFACCMPSPSLVSLAGVVAAMPVVVVLVLPDAPVRPLYWRYETPLGFLVDTFRLLRTVALEATSLSHSTLVRLERKLLLLQSCHIANYSTL